MSDGEKRREHVGRTIRDEVRIRATPGQVYAAWAQPERIARWFVDSAEGEARDGATMTWHFDAMGYHLPVPIVEAVPGERLVIAGEAPGRPAFLQEIVLEQEGGETVLRLANSGFQKGAEWDDEYEGVVSGWKLALATLKHQLERYPERDRVHVFAMRPARFEYADLMPAFTTREGLCGWLAETAELPAGGLDAGSSVRMELRGGESLTGSVLARTARELLLSWREREGVLGLKAFAMGPAGRAVGLDFSSWAREPADRGAAQARLEAALERLVGRHGDS